MESPSVDLCATTINYKECSHCWTKHNAAFVQASLRCVCVSLICFIFKHLVMLT